MSRRCIIEVADMRASRRVVIGQVAIQCAAIALGSYAAGEGTQTVIGETEAPAIGGNLLHQQIAAVVVQGAAFAQAIQELAQPAMLVVAMLDQAAGLRRSFQ
jgi:hypothetical protein